jgi:L-alanine-DL-glutamate epimerase-like enolase superfamily enzyme
VTRIVRIDSYHTPWLCFVKLTAEDGSTGWGQTAPFATDLTAQVLHRLVAPIALGKDSTEIESTVRACFREQYIFKFRGTFLCRAVCGIDTALWDLRGKREGKSVCELLGGSPRGVPVYASSMRRETTPEQEVERFRRWRDEHGASAYKYKIGVPAGEDADSFPGRSEELIASVGGAFPGSFIVADGNGGYSAERAIELSSLLEEGGVAYFEEPCVYWDIDATAAVNARSRVPVCGGEQDYDLLRWRLIFEKRAVSLAQPDVCYLGGLTRTLEVARMAERHGIDVMPHAANPSMVLLFSMHLMAAIPNPGPYLEYGIEESPWVEGAFSPALEMVDGHVAIPEEPGWGVSMNEEWLANTEHLCAELDAR